MITSLIILLVVGASLGSYFYYHLYYIASLKLSEIVGNTDNVLTNTELVRKGLLDGLQGSNSLKANQEPQKNVQLTTLIVLQDKKVENQSDLNRVAEEKFLAENAKKPGVITTTSGLQYEILIKRNGAI